MKDHRKLEELALEATPGPWQAYSTHGRIFIESLVNEMHVVCETPKKQWLKDSDFIAAANPRTVLDLIGEIRRLETKIETIRCLLGSVVPSDDQLDIAINAAIRNGEQS